MAGPKLPDISTLVQAGINPKNGLPIKFGNIPETLKHDVKKCLRIIDEQDAVGRYTWYNLPMNLDSRELERMLYYKGQLCFFYSKELEEFYFMPYALDGTIDFYGRFNQVHPVPMTAGTDADKKFVKTQEEYLSQIKLKPQYGVHTDEVDEDDIFNSCVLLHDYTKQMSQIIIPRVTLNDAIIDVEAECVPFMRTSMINATGVKGVRASDADQAEAIAEAGRNVVKAAMKGEQYVPIIGSMEFQDLGEAPSARVQEYFLAMQSLENFRLSTYGLENGGLFEKVAHTTDKENAVNNTVVGLVYQDGLSIRQNFCNIVNSIWGLGIWCEASESVLGADINGDGVAYDENKDGMYSGSESDEGGEE